MEAQWTTIVLLGVITACLVMVPIILNIVNKPKEPELPSYLEMDPEDDELPPPPPRFPGFTQWSGVQPGYIQPEGDGIPFGDEDEDLPDEAALPPLDPETESTSLLGQVLQFKPLPPPVNGRPLSTTVRPFIWTARGPALSESTPWVPPPTPRWPIFQDAPVLAGSTVVPHSFWTLNHHKTTRRSWFAPDATIAPLQKIHPLARDFDAASNLARAFGSASAFDDGKIVEPLDRRPVPNGERPLSGPKILVSTIEQPAPVIERSPFRHTTLKPLLASKKNPTSSFFASVDYAR